MEKWKCLQCGHEMKEKDKFCAECGSGDFVFGATPNKKGNLVCNKCKGKKFKMISHFDMTKRYASAYQCDCGEVVKIDRMRCKEEMVYWE